MALNSYTATEIADLAAAGVATGVDLATHVKRYEDKDFLNGHGGHAFIRIGAALTAASRDLRDGDTAVIFDELNEKRISVDLTTHLVSAIKMTDAEYSLDLQDFAAQVMVPQSDSIADGIDKKVSDLLAGITAATPGKAYSATKPQDLFVQARRALRAKGVDVANEKLVAFVGGNIVDDLLTSGSLDFSKTGDADALRNGSAGKVMGFTVVETARGVADSEAVFTTASGVYVATRVPAIPEGVTFGAVSAKDGLRVRVIRDYDPSTLSERSIVSTFVGAGISPLYDVTRDYTTRTTTVSEVEGGAVVKFATS